MGGLGCLIIDDNGVLRPLANPINHLHPGGQEFLDLLPQVLRDMGQVDNSRGSIPFVVEIGRLVHEVDRILWKEPTFAHQMFERDELSDFTMRAFDFFQAIPRARARLKATLVMDFQRLEFKKCDNVLAPWWSDDLSRLFQDIQVGKGRN